MGICGCLGVQEFRIDEAKKHLILPGQVFGYI